MLPAVLNARGARASDSEVLRERQHEETIVIYSFTCLQGASLKPR